MTFLCVFLMKEPSFYLTGRVLGWKATKLSWLQHKGSEETEAAFRPCEPRLGLRDLESTQNPHRLQIHFSSHAERLTETSNYLTSKEKPPSHTLHILSHQRPGFISLAMITSQSAWRAMRRVFKSFLKPCGHRRQATLAGLCDGVQGIRGPQYYF